MGRFNYFMGQTGSSGGQGDYAYIKIGYPTGSRVTVTFNGDTVDAPDTSGLWIYGCDENGTYTIQLVGTLITKTVQITTRGQIETIWLGNQVINYKLAYHLGNEFASPSTAQQQYAFATGGWTNRKYTGRTWQGEYHDYASVAQAETINSFDRTQFTKFFAYLSLHIKGQSTQYGSITLYGSEYAGGTITFRTPTSADQNWWLQDANSNIYGCLVVGTHLINPPLSDTINKGDKTDTDISKKDFVLYNIPTIKNDILAVGSIITHDSQITGAWLPETAIVTKNANNIYTKVRNNYNVQENILSEQYMYSAGFVKTDSLSGLSAYGSSINAILSNSVRLFGDEMALSWMVLNCTGDFMISALMNTTFKNAMNASPNKSILVANEHWNRFIALLSV